MKYLKKFNNHAAYEAAQSSLILPNVSLCVSENEVHYNPYVDPYAGHDYVEIGGIKWATMNIGATGVTDTGLYFAWGETQGYTANEVTAGTHSFDWQYYKYGNGTNNPGETGMTKYNSTDGKTVLDLSDDAARANWGGAWRMPTTAEFAALSAATTSAWTVDYEGSGVKGFVCTDKTDSSKVLFFPAAGECTRSCVDGVDSHGYYWSSSLYTNDMKNAYFLYFFFPTRVSWNLRTARFNALTVRPVAD